MISALDCLLVPLLGLATVFDLKDRRIPNRLLAFALAGGILFHSWEGVSSLFDACLGLGFGIGVLFIPFALGWLGAGDVKFVGAIGAVLGRSWLPRVLFYSFLAGGVLAIFSFAWNGADWRRVKTLWRDLAMLMYSRGVVLPETMAGRKFTRAQTIPYGVAIAVGTFIAVYLDPRGEWAGF
jgi:prepilin peptidase CpaA